MDTSSEPTEMIISVSDGNSTAVFDSNIAESCYEEVTPKMSTSIETSTNNTCSVSTANNVYSAVHVIPSQDLQNSMQTKTELLPSSTLLLSEQSQLLTEQSKTGATESPKMFAVQPVPIQLLQSNLDNQVVNVNVEIPSSVTSINPGLGSMAGVDFSSSDILAQSNISSMANQLASVQWLQAESLPLTSMSTVNSLPHVMQVDLSMVNSGLTGNSVIDISGNNIVDVSGSRIVDMSVNNVVNVNNLSGLPQLGVMNTQVPTLPFQPMVLPIQPEICSVPTISGNCVFF